jgi:single-strand DNA-binding protein
MSTVNKVILLGNLGKDPEVRYLENGRMRVQLALATHDVYKTKSGEKVNHTDWHEVVLWTPHAEIAAQYLAKGSQVYVEGKLSHRAYTDKEGHQRYITQVVGQQLTLLNSLKMKHSFGNVRMTNPIPPDNMQEDDMGDLPL